MAVIEREITNPSFMLGGKNKNQTYTSLGSEEGGQQ